MPTYEYECQACGHRFELFQKITAPPAKRCPNCNKDAAKRLISAGAGVIFKGRGFYATDYKKQGTGDKGQGTEKTPPKCDNVGTRPQCSFCPGSNVE